MNGGPAVPALAPVAPWDAARRSASLARTLAARRDAGPVWAFAYGSLIWDPCFVYDDHRIGRLDGYIRRTCVWSVHARGTPEQPGLFYALDAAAGASCKGVVFRLDEEARDESLARLWAREMYTGIYRPAWLEIATEAGPITALGFLVEPDHPQYAGALDLEQNAAVIATATGALGSAADYYRDTVRELRAIGCADETLEALLERAEQRLGSPGKSSVGG